MKIQLFQHTTTTLGVEITVTDTAGVSTNPDIHLDTVVLKISTAPTTIFTANVASEGASGNALWELTPTNTNITPGTYTYDIVWTKTSGQEYVVAHDAFIIKARV